MLRSRRNEPFWPLAVFVLLVAGATLRLIAAERLVLQLKNGDRVTGRLVSENTNQVTLLSTVLGTVNVPLAEISKREVLPETPAGTNAPTNAPAPAGTNLVANAKPPAIKEQAPRGPMTPANPEATPIASTPRYWKHDLRFGLNLRYAEKDSQEFLVIGKSVYGRPPFRHIFDVNFKYGHADGVLSANSLTGSEKTEYQLSRRNYLFNLVGAGYDEVRKIDAQYELDPGFGTELLKLTNFVWKTEAGFSFQQQYRSDNSDQTSYSVRIAEIFAWRVWDKLTADAKLEFFPNLAKPGEYRLRLESTLRYPISKYLSLNLDVIDLYDTQPANNVDPNDLQIRSTIGITF